MHNPWRGRRAVAVVAAFTALGTALLTGAGGLLPVPSADAQSGTYLRLAHLSPDTASVDVLVTSFAGENIELNGVSYGDVSDYRRIDPGQYTVQMRAAGADPASPPVVTGTLEAVDGAAYTAAGLGPFADLAVQVLTDDLARPGADQAKLRVLHGAPTAGTVSLRWADAALLGDAAFGAATDYVTAPAGDGTLEVVAEDGTTTPIPADLAAGGVYSAILVENDGALDVELRTDALGPGTAPVGGIDTGLGGTAPLAGPAGGSAPSADPAPMVLAAGVAALVAAGATGLLARRRRARHGSCADR